MFSIFKRKPPLVTDLSWLSVDIHSHLLPGIDDGAPDVKTSVSLINALNELGISKFICTPHIFNELYPNTEDTITTALKTVEDELRSQEIKVGIAAAAEYMIDEDFKVMDGLLCLPGKYLLIEMSYMNETPNIEQVVFDLQIKGYNVILAHPERYNFYHFNLSRFDRLKDLGCLFQLNLLSVTGYYGREVKKTADYLLKNKLYDLAGTDLHHDKHLAALSKAVKSGELYHHVGQYLFKNASIFNAIKDPS